MTPSNSTGLSPVIEGSPLWTSAEIAQATGGEANASFVVTGVSIDSRALEPGDLFVALRDTRDGHDFVGLAFAAGAAGALVERPVAQRAAVRVRDCGQALTALATAARDRASRARRAAVTGSVGKTSVVQAVRAGLERAASAGAGAAHGSIKSYNNHIGVPLTLARMPAATSCAVFELGMNHAGEIAPLSRLVRPHVVAITNVEAVHVENFADGEAGVARAKAEIFEGVEPGGIAILNADNRWFPELSQAARDRGLRVRAFGTRPDAEARLTNFTPDEGGARVRAEVDGEAIDYPLRHGASFWGPMSLCALLVLRALEVDLESALGALGEFAPLEGRGAGRRLEIGAGRALMIDDSYNASPVSMRAAIADLGRRPARGRRIVAVTDMLELGEDAPLRHAELAEPLAAAGIDLVYCAGPRMRSLYDVLPATRRGGWALDAETIVPALVGVVRDGDVVLVKGSNASRAGRLASALVDAWGGGGA